MPMPCRTVTTVRIQVSVMLWVTRTRARSAFDYGRDVATELGDLKEVLNPGPPNDTFKDQYNNEVGRRIAEYVRDNNLPESAIDELIMDALRNDDLIVNDDDSLYGG